MIDHHVDEFMLMRCQVTTLQESVERAFCSCTIEPYKRTNKHAEAALLPDTSNFLRTHQLPHVGRLIRSSSLRSVEVSGSLRDGASGSQCGCYSHNKNCRALAQESLHIGADGNPAELHGSAGADLILKIRVYSCPLLKLK